MIRRVVSSSSTVTILPAWGKPTWMRWRATWMPPRLETLRWTVWACGGSGSGPARRTPWSLCRWPGGSGQGRVRHKTPFWVMTCMSWPSSRIRARWPASGEPIWMTWLPSVMIPAALASRCTSTRLLPAGGPGAGPAGGGPAGRAPAFAEPREVDCGQPGWHGLDPPSADAHVHGGGVDPEADALAGPAGAQPELLRPDRHVPRGGDGPLDLDGIRPAHGIRRGQFRSWSWRRSCDRLEVSRSPQCQVVISGS